MKIMVTGAAGFIGSHLCEALLAQGEKVVGLDNFDDFYDPAIKRKNIAECLRNDKFHLYEVDIRDADGIANILQTTQVDLVVHLAAKAGVRPSIADPLLYQDVNINGTMILLEAARNFEIKKFIFASSSSVYGNNKKVPFAESDHVDFPISPYAATKKAGELICHAYSHLYGMDMTCLRFFTAYGPRQRPDLAIHKFARLILNDEPIPVYGDGSMMRDYTYIDDIIQGVRGAMNHCRNYHIYNLGESKPVRLDELIAALEKVLGKKAQRRPLPCQPGDAQQTYADISQARTDLGYDPKTSLDAGLKHFSEWLQN